MGLSLISLDAPTTAWAAMFTRNAAPGAPVRIGRARLASGAPLQVRVLVVWGQSLSLPLFLPRLPSSLLCAAAKVRRAAT
jgi:hypothetical protein